MWWYKYQQRLLCLILNKSQHLFMWGNNLSSFQHYTVTAGDLPYKPLENPLKPVTALSFTLWSPLIVSILHQLVHLRWVDHGTQHTQRPGVAHCWCWQLLQAILYVLSILYYISALVYIEVLYVDVCVLVHFPVGQLAESDGLVLTWGPFTVNLTLLRGQSYFYYLTLWSGTSPSIHHTLLHLRMCCKFITKEAIYNTIYVLNEVLQNHREGHQLTPLLIHIQQSKATVGFPRGLSPGRLLLQTVV